MPPTRGLILSSGKAETKGNKAITSEKLSINSDVAPLRAFIDTNMFLSILLHPKYIDERF